MTKLLKKCSLVVQYMFMYPRKRGRNWNLQEISVTFVGYSETSKAYKIYTPKHRQVEVSRDVIFDEEATYKKSKESHMEIDDEEKEASRITNSDPSRPHPLGDQEELEEPSNQDDPPIDVAITRKRPT